MNVIGNALQKSASALSMLAWSPAGSGLGNVKGNGEQWILAESTRIGKELRGQDESRLRENTAQLRAELDQQRSSPAAKLGPSTPFAGQHGRQLALAVATATEALRRSHGVELYPTQIRAGLAMCDGKIAEMQTGEGKTFAGFIPSSVLGMLGRGVHVCMPNAYLAARDESLLAKTFSLLGLTSAVRRENDSFQVTRRAYDADVTFGAGQLFGFDYLRDQWTMRQSLESPLGSSSMQRLAGHGIETQMRTRGLHAAVVDEADQVLVDDATSPLLITAAEDQAAADAPLHHAARVIALSLVRDRDYKIETILGGVELTDRGFDQVYQDEALATDPLLCRPWHAYVLSAIKAECLLRRDRQYVVIEGKIRLVEQSTGRIFADRTWSDGLHQAVQAKEGLPITAETESQGRICRQVFFRLYENLCGMTGTARSCRQELRSIYGLDVVEIPTYRPSLRQQLPIGVYASEACKLQGVIVETCVTVAQGRSVLIGTNHIDQTNRVAGALRKAGIRPHVLNGIQSEAEANIIAGAGQPGVVTVATHLAGRGTDIKLHPSVKQAGGLHVIAWEHHRLSRVDRQLVGRGARQGDPGTARFCISPDDQFVSIQAPYLAPAVVRCLDAPDLVEALCRAVQAAQRRLEADDRRGRFRLLRDNERPGTAMSGVRRKPRARHTRPTSYGVIR